MRKNDHKRTVESEMPYSSVGLSSQTVSDHLERESKTDGKRFVGFLIQVTTTI